MKDQEWEPVMGSSSGQALYTHPAKPSLLSSALTWNIGWEGNLGHKGGKGLAPGYTGSL